MMIFLLFAHKKKGGGTTQLLLTATGGTPLCVSDSLLWFIALLSFFWTRQTSARVTVVWYDEKSEGGRGSFLETPER